MQSPKSPTILMLPLVLAGGSLFAQTKPLIENDQVRVIKAVDQPHVKGKPHDHKVNRVMIYLQAGRQEVTADGKTTTATWKAGEVKWSPATGTHVPEIVSDAPVTMVEVELKKEGVPGKSATGALDPLKIDPKDYTLEFENSQVRVIRVKMAPHHPVPLHEHMLNRVVVYITDQKTSITAADGTVEKPVHNAGEASWGAPAKHKEENLNDKPFEAVVVELKS